MRCSALRSARSLRNLAIAAIAGCVGAGTPAVASASLGAWRFVSAPGLMPPHVRVDMSGIGTAAGLIFLDPFKNFAVKTPPVGQPGGLIVNRTGNPVWFRPVPSTKDFLNLEVQRYESRPVLTYWIGSVSVPPSTALPAGTPEPGGKFYIESDTYKLIRTVTAANGWIPDPHEFTLTSRGTAIFTADKLVTAPVSTVAGAQTVRLVDSEVQEINLRTDRLVFAWDMLDHVPLTESQVPVPATGGIWDPFHMNSIDEEGNTVLVSARNTNAVYEINHTTGKVVWQLGGTGSTFTLGPNASFSWQHDARFAAGHEIALYDDACCDLGVPGAEPQHASRGLVLKLNVPARTATLVHEYEHEPDPIAVSSQGNMQTLADGHEFVGWGQSPDFSEYTPSGTLLYQASLPAAEESYRAQKYAWDATPYYAPRVAVTAGRTITVYASWNGATDVSGWRVLAGRTAGTLKVIVGDHPRRRFETAIPFRSSARDFAVEALGADGRVLRRSKIVALGAYAAAAQATAQSTGATTIQTTRRRRLGTVLAASNGHAIYLFSRDTTPIGTCRATCAKSWSPLLAGRTVTIKPGSRLNARLLGTARNSTGQDQVTYNRHPLYTYTGDTTDKTTAGEGANQDGGYWYVVGLRGHEIKPKRSFTSPCDPVCAGY